LRIELPRSEAHAPMRYGMLLRSLGELLRSEPALRLHSALGALSFAAFSAFWATLALHLHALPGHYGPRTAGSYGVAGLVGALAAYAGAVAFSSFGWGGVCAVGAACAAAALLLVRSRAGNYARGQSTLAAPANAASSSTSPLT